MLTVHNADEVYLSFTQIPTETVHSSKMTGVENPKQQTLALSDLNDKCTDIKVCRIYIWVRSSAQYSIDYITCSFPNVLHAAKGECGPC